MRRPGDENGHTSRRQSCAVVERQQRPRYGRIKSLAKELGRWRARCRRIVRSGAEHSRGCSGQQGIWSGAIRCNGHHLLSKKTRPHKAAGIVDIGMSLSVLLQFRARIAVDKMKLSIEIPPFSPTFKGKQKNNRGGMAVEAGVTRAPARKPLFSPWVPGAEHSVITVQ